MWSARVLTVSRVLLTGSALLLGAAGCAPPPSAIAAAPPPEIETKIKEVVTAAAPGAEPVGNLFRGSGQDGAFADFHVEMESEQCYWLVGVGEEAVKELSLTVWDSKDDRVRSERSDTRVAVIQHCPTKTETFKFEGKIAGGAGHFAIGIFTKEAPEAPKEPKKAGDPDAPPPKKVELEKVIATEAQAIATGVKQVGKFYKSKGEKSTFFIELDAGICYWMVSAAQAGNEDFKIYLWDQDGKRLGMSKSEPNDKAIQTAHIGYCPKDKAMYHVELKTSEETDDVQLGIYAKAGGGP